MAVERESLSLIAEAGEHKNNKNKIVKEEIGITLVALIVTIIILMILAGVVVATVTGNNGILSKSKFARDTYQNSINEENGQISSYENEIDKTAIDVASSRENGSIKYETVFEGIANEKGKTYELQKSINDYDMIIVYSEDKRNKIRVSNVIDKSAYRIGVKDSVHMNFAHAFDSYYYFIYYSFPTETSIYIYPEPTTNKGWPAGQIYLIKGIKF